MILELMIIISAGFSGAVITYYSIDECRGKEKILLIISKTFLILTASLMTLLVNDWSSLVFGLLSGVILMYALMIKLKMDLSPIALGLGIGLTNNLFVDFLSILYLIPSTSLLSLKMLVKKKGLNEIIKKVTIPIALIFVFALVGFYGITSQKLFAIALVSGSLIFSSTNDLLRLKR